MLTLPSGAQIAQSTVHVESRIAWFSEYLAACGVSVAPMSALGRSLSALRTHGRIVRGEELPFHGERGLQLMREGHGIDYFIRAAAACPDQLAPLVRREAHLLRGADLNFFRTSTSGKGRNVGWELLVGSWAAAFSRQITFDKTDVHFHYADQAWSIECKQLYSAAPNMYVRRAVDGAKQLESRREGLGFVVLGLSNLIPHERFLWATPTKFDGSPSPEMDLSNWLDELWASMNLDELQARLTGANRETPRVWARAVLFVAQTLAWIDGQVGVLTGFRVFSVRTVDFGEHELLERLYRAAREVLGSGPTPQVLGANTGTSA